MNNKSLPDWTESENIDAKHPSVKIINNIESLNVLIADMPQETQYGWEELDALFISVL